MNSLPIILTEHLSLLDHSQVADLVGDAHVVELLTEISRGRGQAVSRGKLLLDVIGGPSVLLENKSMRRRLLLTLSTGQELALRTALNVPNVFEMRLNAQRRTILYQSFSCDLAHDGPPEKRKPSSTKCIAVEYGLFPHQSAAVLECQKFLSAPSTDARYGRVMLHMPTGSGKTRTAVHLICRHLNGCKQGVVLWLVSGLELCLQAAAELEQAWKMLGERPLPIVSLWGETSDVDLESFTSAAEKNRRLVNDWELLDGTWTEAIGDAIVIASVDSLHRAVDKWEPRETINRAKRVSLLVFDEAHRSTAPTYARLLEIFSTRAGILGLSATPGRHHFGDNEASADEKLTDLFEGNKVVLTVPGFESPVQALIEQGYLARLTLEKLEVAGCVSTTSVAAIQRHLSKHLDLDERLLRIFGLSATRNLQLVERVERLIKGEGHKRVILFAPSVQSAMLVSNILTALNVKSYAVSSQTPTQIRHAILDEYLSEAELPLVLCNYGVLTTGFDAPRTSAVVIGRPTTSIVLLSQMAGRALRGPKVGGNINATVVTVVDTSVPELSETIGQFHAFDHAWRNQE